MRALAKAIIRVEVVDHNAFHHYYNGCFMADGARVVKLNDEYML
jgi:hypothetical protein